MQYDPEQPPPKGRRDHSPSGLYIIRLYDHFDGWLSAHPNSKGVPWEEAVALWNKETSNGTTLAQQRGDRDYWSIFPANTRMIYTPEFSGR